MSSDEKPLLINEKNIINFEKKLRFRQPSVSKVLNNNDKVEDLFKNEKSSDSQTDVNRTGQKNSIVVYFTLLLFFVTFIFV